ncbi:outer membrane protein assembly factor BamB family protein [Actinophytocola sediminis]
MVRLVATVAAAGGGAAVLLPGGPVRPDHPDLEVLGGAAALVVVAALTYVRNRWSRPAAGLLAAGGAAWAVYLLLGDLASGLPGASTAVLAACAAAAVVGIVADAVRPVRLSLAVPLVVVLVAAAVAGGLLAPRLPVRASEASAVEPPALAREPGERRWTWRTSEAVLGIVAAGAGVVVAVGGGELAALDGPTGAIRWRYARPGARVLALVSTPDRATVVAAFAPGGGQVTGAALLVVLDAITGGVLRESIVDDSEVDFLVPTNNTLPLRHHATPADGTLRGVELRTGAELWTWSAPAGCTSPFHLPRSGAEVVLTTIRCGDRTGVLALDERDGERRWEHLADVPASSQVDYFLSTSQDGAVVAVQFAGRQVLLRTEDGTELTEVDRSASVEVGTHPLLTGEPTDEIGPEIVDPDTGERTELPSATCADPRAEATTASAYLRVCGPDTDASLVWQDFAGDGQLARTPIGWGASTSPSSRMLGLRAHAVVLPAPGAIVVARAGDLLVTGYPG